MDDQIILAVGEKGNFTGQYIPKMVGHTGEGQKHLAISVLLHNSKGQVLLQKRKHKIFDNIWDITGATHPLHKKDKDETLEEATKRCLEVEYGITDKINLKNAGFFDYFAKYGELCENEHCAILVGEYNGFLKLNPEVGYGYKWMEKGSFLKDIESSPQNYTSWAKEAVKVLKKTGFFNG